MNYSAAVKKIAPIKTIDTVFNDIEKISTFSERDGNSLSISFQGKEFKIVYDEHKMMFSISISNHFKREGICIDKMINMESIFGEMINHESSWQYGY